MNGFKVMEISRFCCDQCEADCYPDSSDPRDWLYEFDGDQLCWECLLDAACIQVIND